MRVWHPNSFKCARKVVRVLVSFFYCKLCNGVLCVVFVPVSSVL